MIRAARKLAAAADAFAFPPPVAHVYNPLAYGWEAHEQYLARYAHQRKRALFLGMNPGPFGMMQTAVPFGEIASVRDWLGIHSGVCPPRHQHPKRPIDGFAFARSEVSGRRLWGLFRRRFTSSDAFFADHFVANYCPLALLESSGRNFTPNKLPATPARKLKAVCDAHLREIVSILQPEWVVAVGAFAGKQAESALAGASCRIGQILHPSPANPAANRGWAVQAEGQLRALGVWPEAGQSAAASAKES